MEDAARRLHTFKGIFLPKWVGKTAQANGNAPRTELMKKGKADAKKNAETCTLSQKWRGMNAWQDYIRQEIDVSKDLDANLHLWMIHMRSHWVKLMCWYGALQQYSAERHEQAHEMNLMDGWNASNHNINYLPEVITLQCRILGFEIRELHLQALAQHWKNSPAACNILPSGPDLAAPLSSQSYVKPGFMGPQNRRDRTHPDSIIKDSRAWLDNMQNATHHIAIYNSIRPIMKPTSCNKTYISEEQLHAMELCVYPGIEVQVEG